jgi:hypothetical protein
MAITEIPIKTANTDASDAKRLAVHAISEFLRIYGPFPEELLNRSKAPSIIAGHWLSRVKGFHNEDDFLQLTRDVLLYIQSGGAPSRVSEQLVYFFSGFMPTYGAARTILAMGEDDRPWSEMQAFLHGQGYGNARQYVQTFDWKAGEKKANTELEAWTKVVSDQVEKLRASSGVSTPMLGLLAPTPFLAPQPAPITVSPELGRILRPVPLVVPATGAAAESLGARLLTMLGALRAVTTILYPTELNSGEDEWLRQRDEALKQKKLLVRDVQQQIEAAVNTTHNECKAQIEANQANGAKCEDGGYTIMEQSLQYKRLIDPPKGRGLDGLFEKLPPEASPFPFPESVALPSPGKLLFIPMEQTPPRTTYDYAGKPPMLTYPKFVVLEAKNIETGLGEKDTDAIQKKSKERLKNTCDGQQLSEPWTEKRIPQALKRGMPGDVAGREAKRRDIGRAGYARWIFVCLPGPVGSNTKLFVIIDVQSSGMDLEYMKPKPRGGRSSPTPPDGSY